jgi:hypothetical protein
MKIARTARLTLCLIALMTILPAAGCDWLDPSGSGARVSPVIGALDVTPKSVFCGDPDRQEGDRNEITVSFEYNDEQDDLYQLNMTLEHEETGEIVEQSVLWTDLDLSSAPGRAIYREFFFECGLYPKGDWKLTVKAEDERGHLSNTLSDVITLLSGG